MYLQLQIHLQLQSYSRQIHLRQPNIQILVYALQVTLSSSAPALPHFSSLPTDSEICQFCLDIDASADAAQAVTFVGVSDFLIGTRLSLSVSLCLSLPPFSSSSLSLSANSFQLCNCRFHLPSASASLFYIRISYAIYRIHLSYMHMSGLSLSLSHSPTPSL